MILIKEIERLNNESLNREELGNHFSKLSKFIDILNEAGLVDNSIIYLQIYIK